MEGYGLHCLGSENPPGDSGAEEKMRGLMYRMDWNENIPEKGGQLQGFCNHRLGLDEIIG